MKGQEERSLQIHSSLKKEFLLKYFLKRTQQTCFDTKWSDVNVQQRLYLIGFCQVSDG